MLLRDICLVAVLLAVCASVALGVRGLKTSAFEPLGPAAFPLVLAGVIATLALALLAQTYLRSRKGEARGPSIAASPPDAFEDEPVKRYPSMAFAIMGLAVAFGLAIEYLRLDFAWTAFAFLIAVMTVMTRFSLAAVPVTLAIAAISAFGCNYIFTEVLVIYLP